MRVEDGFNPLQGLELLQRYRETGDPAFLYEVLRRSPLGQAPHHGPPGYLHLQAAEELLERFDQTGEIGYLDMAIDMLRDAAVLRSDDDRQVARLMCDVGGHLRVRFERGGDTADLEEAVEIGRQTVAATGPGHPDHSGMLSQLGTSLMTRGNYDQTRSVSDLDEAITCFRRAVAEAPSAGPFRAMYLSNLSSALQSRFAESGDLASLDEAIDANRRALTILPPGDPRLAAMRANFCHALLTRFGRRGEEADLDQAIEHARRAALSMGTANPHLGEIRMILGKALRSRFEWRHEPTDLDAAIAQFRLVGTALPANHPLHFTCLQELSSALLVRFGTTGDMADFTESAAACRRQASIPDDPGVTEEQRL